MPEEPSLAESTPKTAKRLSRPQLHKRKQLEQDIEHITVEMYKRNKELAETNKTLSLLRTIDALVLESHTTLSMVTEHITEAITQAADFAFVGLLPRSARVEDELELNSWSGSSWLGKKVVLGFSRPLHLKLDHPWFGQLGDTKLVSLESFTDAELASFLGCPESDIKRVRHHLPLKSMYVVKLMARRKLVGLLVVGFLGSAQDVNQADITLMDRLSESVGVALDNKLLFEENQHVLRQLKLSNTKLKALDEAKDDFISMASHQLRTPLTSVKGYISMIKEGDAGKVTPSQDEMLNQAFFSAQRMVYLIADLLNVSRLRTGKFVIDPAPVDLAQMITEELEQVNELAKIRSQKIVYKQPKPFPELMLDDVKTRQVIMNFVDNALHYTPAKGTVAVTLAETPTTVEMRVKDNGIGVPRSEQHHLFTKFYRAANARQTRPDGTGLGLFMAKKVIIAQGGSVIFDSTEGKASTFGFILSKARLAVPKELPNTFPETPSIGSGTKPTLKTTTLQ